MFKKLLSITVCLTMCMALLPVSVQATDTAEAAVPGIPTEGDVWDGSISQPTTLVQKDGVYYYEITKCSELAYVAQTGGEWLGYNYILGKNLILNDVELTWDENGTLTNTETLLEWTPIGESNGDGLNADDIASAFSGNFEGAGYSVSGMYIEQEYDSKSNVGLFGYMHGNVSIKNLNVVNSYIHITEPSTAEIDVSIGGICAEGEQYGCSTTISNCSFSGIINNETTNGDSAGITKSCSNVNKCTNYGSILSNSLAAGIVCSAGQSSSRVSTIKNCFNYGNIRGGTSGGIIGSGYKGSCTSCKNYGKISGTVAGGIMGRVANISDNKFPLYSCENHGEIYGSTSSGGIIGHGCGVYDSVNKGQVSGVTWVGGIIGAFSTSGVDTISGCGNFGTIWGESYVGGICGAKRADNTRIRYIENSYNVGEISGISYVGGIIGENKYVNISNCYSIGSVQGDAHLGLFSGCSDHIWDKSQLSANYYLKVLGISGIGDDIADETGICEGKVASDLIKESTFLYWDFEDVWSISADTNGGYPYLQWQKSMLTDIPVSSVQISEAALSLVEGDYAYLMATVSPANASNQTITWSSSDSDIATVSAAGKVTAISAGTATITSTTENGGYTATCTVTVTERFAYEYQINSIIVRDSNGKKLSVIPNEEFLATVSITNIASEGNTLVLLASYANEGRYQGMMWVSVEDLPVGATCKVTLPVDNTNGKIANLKAFTVPSFNNLTPLGDAVSFLTE